MTLPRARFVAAAALLLATAPYSAADVVSFLADTPTLFAGASTTFDSDEGVEVEAAAFTSAPNGLASNENAPFVGGLSPVLNALNSGGFGLGVLTPGDDIGQIDGAGPDEVLRITFPTPVTILSIAFGSATGNDGFDLGVSPTPSFTDAVDVDVPADESFGSDNFVTIAGTSRGAFNPFLGVTLDFTPGVEITDGDPDGPAVPFAGRSFYFYTNADSTPRDDYRVVSIEFETPLIDPNEVPEPASALLSVTALTLGWRRRRQA